MKDPQLTPVEVSFHRIDGIYFEPVWNIERFVNEVF